MTIRLELAYPVSANRYWRPVRIKPKRGTDGKERISIVPTSEAKAYKDECAWRAKAAGVREPLTSLVELRIVLVPKNGICMDLDNALKVTIDALKGIAYRDDSQVRKIVAERAEADGRGGLVVEITAAGPPAPEPMVLDLRIDQDAAKDRPVRVVPIDGKDPF